MSFIKDVQLISDLLQAVILIIPGDDYSDIITDGDNLLEAISNHTPGNHIIIEDDTGFLADSLFCEWAYIINLDSDKLEIYKGFNKDPQAKGRYAHLYDEDGVNNGYYGVALVLELPFDKLKALSCNQINELCNILESGSGVESYLLSLPKYNIAKPPTTRDRIQLLELG